LSASHIPIRVSTLRGDQPITFDAYVRVAGKFILFCREGDSFEGQRLERLRTKKLQKMWILKEHEPNYRGYLRKNISRAYEAKSGASLEVRTQIIQGALQATAEDLMEDPSNDGTYRIALESAQQFRNFLIKEPESLSALLKIKNADQNVAHHGVSVSSLALSMAHELGLMEARPMQMDPLVVGCLIHDLEHNHNNINLLVNPSSLSRNEYEIYARHSEQGAERIRPYAFYDKLVSDIIVFHEEKMDGSGFIGKREKELDTLVLIAATANAFDHYLKYGQMELKEGLKNILIDKMGLYPLEIMRALQDALKKRGAI
jgi:putative nucleotidyltransferase with HDIG domain